MWRTVRVDVPHGFSRCDPPASGVALVVLSATLAADRSIRSQRSRHGAGYAGIGSGTGAGNRGRSDGFVGGAVLFEKRFERRRRGEVVAFAEDAARALPAHRSAGVERLRGIELAARASAMRAGRRAAARGRLAPESAHEDATISPSRSGVLRRRASAVPGSGDSATTAICATSVR